MCREHWNQRQTSKSVPAVKSLDRQSPYDDWSTLTSRSVPGRNGECTGGIKVQKEWRMVDGEWGLEWSNDAKGQRGHR